MSVVPRHNPRNVAGAVLAAANVAARLYSENRHLVREAGYQARRVYDSVMGSREPPSGIRSRRAEGLRASERPDLAANPMPANRASWTTPLQPMAYSSSGRTRRRVIRRRGALKRKVRARTRRTQLRTAKRKAPRITYNAVQKALALPNYYHAEIGDVYAVPAAETSVNRGLRGSFFACNWDRVSVAGNYVCNPFGAQDPDVLRNIGFLINNTAQPSMKYTINGWQCLHTLTNMSTLPLKLEAWKCRAMRDLPAAVPYTGGPMRIMGQGLAELGIDTINPNAGNAGLSELEYEPHMFAPFARSFSIGKKTIKVLRPGATCKFRLRSGTFQVVPTEFVSMESGQTLDDGALLAEWRQGETFYLFRVSQNAQALASGASNSLTGGYEKIAMNTEMQWTFTSVTTRRPTTTQWPDNRGVVAPPGAIMANILHINPLDGVPRGAANAG